MSKFWKIGSRQDSLFYYAYAPNRETAIKLAEAFTGPMNPNNRVTVELPAMPAGYKLGGQVPCILEEDPESEE
jgi:hypothetical protein